MVKLGVKVSEKLDEQMSKISWIDWSSVAVKAISERLRYLEELKLKIVAELSEISENADRVVKASLAQEGCQIN